MIRAIPINMFFYDKDSKTLSQEISTLEGSGYKMTMDIKIVSPTGNTVIFDMKKEHRDRENDITHWTFGPSAKSLKEVPECAGVELLLWND